MTTCNTAKKPANDVREIEVREKDELLTEDTATLGLEVGKRLTDRLAFSAKPSVRLNGSEEFAWPIGFSLSYLLD